MSVRAKVTTRLAESLYVIVAIVLISASGIISSGVRTRDLANLQTGVEAITRSHAGEAEARFERIREALLTLANKGLPEETDQAPDDAWGLDAWFYVNNFQGVQAIAWIDESYVVRRTVPPIRSAQGETASEVDWGHHAVTSLVPIYNGTDLEGFVLGVVDIDAFVSPIVDDLRDAYGLELVQEKTNLLATRFWREADMRFVTTRSITLRNTAVWEISIAPTVSTVRRARAKSEQTLVYSLFLSLMTTLAVLYAQRYSHLSRLNALRFRRMLETMSDGCFVLGPDWRILFINDAASHQFSQPSSILQGRTLHEAAPDLVGSPAFELAQRCVAERTSASTLQSYTLEDGSSGWHELSIHPAPDGLMVLSTDVTERVRRERDISELNATLEQRVGERTALLEEANNELEAFSYSVSHDLRAPLRAVDGYVQILVEDYGSELDEEGQRVCSVISDSARDMGKLIDDLLILSRVGRRSITSEQIDMSAMALSVFEELTTAQQRQRIALRIDDLPKAHGDAGLIRQVWTNLISNAIKFTSKKQNPSITVCASEKDGHPVYSIADNGAGFDMQYVDKLFGVFQRLHSVREFEGTGAGLAIVQRIIHRHRGRVWAEGIPDQGAVFYFQLNHGA